MWQTGQWWFTLRRSSASQPPFGLTLMSFHPFADLSFSHSSFLNKSELVLISR